jgi:hypothetical protein
MKKTVIIIFCILFLIILSFSIYIGTNYSNVNSLKNELLELNNLQNQKIDNLTSSFNKQSELLDLIISKNKLLNENIASIENSKSSYLNDITFLKNQIKINAKEINALTQKQRDIINKLKEKDDLIEMLKNQFNKNNNESSVKENKNNNWQLTISYSDVDGPYIYDDDLLFIYPDGSYNIISIEGNVKKNGKLGHSVFIKPIIENKKVYYMSKDGFLSLYDFQYDKIMWEQQLDIPSKIDLYYTNEYILFSTPDKQSIIVHKKTGVVVGKFNFGEWDVPPIISGNNIYSFTEQYINVYSIENNFKISDKIKNPFAKFKNIYTVNNLFFAEIDKGFILFNPGNYSENNSFVKYNIYPDIYLFYKEDKIYSLIGSEIKSVNEKNNLIYINDQWKIYNDNNISTITNTNDSYDVPEIKFKNIIKIQSSIILVSINNIIYCRGIK